MDELFDSLSEEWVSQPRSSSPASIGHNSPTAASSSQVSITSQSRIPRYKPRSASTSNINERILAGRKGSSQKEGRPLNEKTASDLNAHHRRAPSGSPKTNGQSPGSIHPQLRQRHTSTNSLSSIQQGTVQCRLPYSSPPGDGSKLPTPDWKRRVLDGKVKSGEQLDLFGPIGLESIFRPPVASAQPQQKKGRRYQPMEADDFPSSPPTYPPPTQRSPQFNSNASQTTSVSVPAPGRTSSHPLNSEQSKVDSFKSGFVSTVGQSLVSQPRSLHYTEAANLETAVSANIRHATKPSSPHSVGRKKELPPRTAYRIDRTDGKSGSTSMQTLHDRARITSAQEDLRHEKISPVLVSRQNTIDGQINYAALDHSMIQLRTEMDRLGMQQQDRPSSRLSDRGIDYRGTASPKIAQAHDIPINDLTSHSLPDDLSMGTEAFDTNGGYVSVRRGGYSTEGSFHRRSLSPSSFQQSDSIIRIMPMPPKAEAVSLPKHLSVSSEIANQEGTESVEPCPVPKTPKRQEESASAVGRPRSSGSPLKLFDKYDTFTNDRLARRMSQFEDSFNKIHSDGINKVESSSKSSETRLPPHIEEERHQLSQGSQKRQGNRGRYFGDGALQDYGFTHRVSSSSSAFLLEDEDEDQENYPPLPVLRPAEQTRFRLQPNSRGIQEPRGKFGVDPEPSSKSSNHQDVQQQEGRLQIEKTLSMIRRPGHRPAENVRISEGKRLLNSPAKDPSPKRRRTSYSVEVPVEVIGRHRHQDSNSASIRPIAGRKRKDTRYGNGEQAADPKIIAMRQILRPRTPTPNQIRFNEPQVKVTYTTSACRNISNDQEVDSEAGTRDEQYGVLDVSTHALARELAVFAANATQNAALGERKASVATADYLKDAEQVMRRIRAQGRPQSARTTAEQSEIEQLGRIEESIHEESTLDEFSRPPSREGGSLRRLREPKQLDARIISHLRKFEEKEDFGIALSSSVKSLHLAKERQSLPTAAGNDPASIRTDIESDPPNIRIHDTWVQTHEDQQSRSSMQSVPMLIADVGANSQASHSSGPSTGRSVPTSSSTGSGNKAVIAPEKVRHLISDQVAGMTFDRARQVWVKRKGSNTSSSSKHDRAASDVTDEDPFGEIPDLSVDELEEMQRIKTAASLSNMTRPASNSIVAEDHAQQDRLRVELLNHTDKSDEKQDTASVHVLVETSSPTSKYSRLASSALRTDTRVTSWNDNIAASKGISAQIEPTLAPRTPEDAEHEEEVEHEISILEGRVSRTPTRASRGINQPRVVTIAISSPLMGEIQAQHPPISNSQIWEDDSELDLSESPDRQHPEVVAGILRRTPLGYTPRSSHRRSRRRVSIGSQSYIARPISRIDEQDELSYLQCAGMGGRNTSMEVALSTPQPLRDLPGSMSMPPPTTRKTSNVTFHLSPLPDFTVHQIDEAHSRDVSYIAERRGLSSLQEVNGTFSLAISELVKKITDVEPYEPYWEYIRKLDLRNKNLPTLHMLDDFCGRIEELDVSDNELGQLNGAPSSLLYLIVRDNCLSDMTAWGHLQNLQFLDISGNQLQSLQGFQGLVHLREIRADDNHIESLEGIFGLNGLLKLSARRNQLRRVDFEGSGL